MEIKAALTEMIAAQAVIKDRQRKLSDGGGMYLLVHPSGGKYWRMDYRFGGKKRTLAIGVYPDVSLDMARTRREDARKLLADGIDPSDTQKVIKAVERAERQAQKEAQLADEARLIVATRFMLDNEGALSFRFGNRHIALTISETIDLRTFLDATRSVISKGSSCL
jgi:hypothetical protein